MFKKYNIVKNGDLLRSISIYICDLCKKSFNESDPHHAENERDLHYCWDCTFLKGKITEETYLEYCGIEPSLAYTRIDGDEIHIYLK